MVLPFDLIIAHMDYKLDQSILAEMMTFHSVIPSVLAGVNTAKQIKSHHYGTGRSNHDTLNSQGHSCWTYIWDAFRNHV